MVHFQCDRCQALLAVDDALRGTTLPCPDCNAEVRVPEIDARTTPATDTAFKEGDAPVAGPVEIAVVRLLAAPRRVVFDVALPILVDGAQVAAGSIKKGLDVVVRIPVGSHTVSIFGAKHTLDLDAPGHYEVKFQFSVMWGNYSLAPQVKRVSPHTLADWPATADGDDPESMADTVTRREDEEVLAELDALQSQRPGWGGAIALLIVSLLLFTGAARTQDWWGSLYILLPVLFFHEMGHYVAMRVFGYRNLRMFFIPFFGAAVSGQNYNVAGWKKALVALAGPVPGILLGVPIGIVGLVANQPTVIEVSLMLLILNGFNLLPFLPLDGGWVVHALLFIRHPVLEVVFRVLAALAMLGIAWPTSSWCLVAVAVFMLIATPITYKLARIAYRLREEGLVARSLDAHSIPREAALQILAELRRDLPAQTPPKTLAQHIINVFETFNAEPPGALVTIAILVVHVSAFVASLVVSVIITVLQHPLG